MLTPGEQDAIRKEEARANEEELFRAKVRKSLPKPPRRTRLRAAFKSSTLVTGLLLWLLTVGLAAGISWYWNHHEAGQAKERRQNEIKTEAETRLFELSRDVFQDRYVLVFEHPPKLTSRLSYRLYDDILAFLEQSPASAPEKIPNSYPAYSGWSLLTLARQISESDSEYDAVPGILQSLYQETKTARTPVPNSIIMSPEAQAKPFPESMWKAFLIKLPDEWKRILAPAFRVEITAYSRCSC